MFRNHAVDEAEICRYLQRAADGYMVASHDELPVDAVVYRACYLESESCQVFRLSHPDGESMRRVVIRKGVESGAAPLLDGLTVSADVAIEPDGLRVVRLNSGEAVDSALADALLDYAADLGAPMLFLPEAVKPARLRARALARKCLRRLPDDTDPASPLALSTWL
jgi:hypothetical protein